MRFGICILGLLIWGVCGVTASELTSENNFKLKAVHQAVPKTDGNHDGILTLTELREYVERKFSNRATSRSNLYLGHFLKNEPEADQNHDGVLTKAELLYHLREPIQGLAAAQSIERQQLFRKVDP